MNNCGIASRSLRDRRCKKFEKCECVKGGGDKFWMKLVIFVFGFWRGRSDPLILGFKWGF